MSRLPVVVVLGRPNVGKSTLVNRILRRRAAVVEEKPGVTRDRKEFQAEWAGRNFLLVDTGGWAVKGDDLALGIREQAEAALSAADVVLFVADARSAVTDDDLGVARLIQQSGVPHLLVANKVDGPTTELETGPLWSLGLGEPIAVSALHGRNTGDLLDRLVLIGVCGFPENLDGPVKLAGHIEVEAEVIKREGLELGVAEVPGDVEHPLEDLAGSR